ncbi:MAG: GNVR domain-containing protein [Deltaproteobacteria bacterium]|nr:GNVR domain-containing protein [Deltaproteobacteria bacterium]
MNEQQGGTAITVQSIVKILKRRMWFIIIPFVLVTPVVSLYALNLPNVFEASATILITPQKVPVDYVRPTVTTDIGDRVDIIIKQMLSYDRLNQLVDEFNLYPELVDKLTREEIFFKMMGDIKISPEESLTRNNEDRSPGQPRVVDSFKINYQGKNPRIVAAVANKLASIFIEENLREREQLAVGTSDFLTKELEQAKVGLGQQEAKVAEYKQKHRGMLPAELQTNLNKLERLQGTLHTISATISAEEDRRITLEKTLTELNAASYEDDPGQRLAELEARLSAMRAVNLTERHPDLVATKREMDLVKERLAYERANPDASAARMNPATLQTRQELTASKLRHESLREQEVEMKAAIAKVEGMVGETPRRQEELNTIERDLSMTQRQYQDLLVKMQNARMAENLERKQKGEQFRVLNTAQIPTRPIEPDRSKIVTFGVFLSIMFGAALGVLVEVSDHSIRGPVQAQSYFGIPVLATIPRVVLDTERTRRAALQRSMVIAGTIVVGLLGGSLVVVFLLRSA